MARGPPTEGPPPSWDRHRATRAAELGLGAWPAGGVSAAASACPAPETSLPHSAPGPAMPLAAIALLVLGAPLVLAGTSCLGYLDESGSWHPGFGCPPFTFCCGTCHRRYCCGDLNLLLSEWQQKRCQGLRPRILAGIASAVVLFVAVVATSICCCLCACHHLYRRHQQLQSLFEGPAIPMTGPAALQPGFLYPPGGPPHHPFYPAGPPPYNPAAPPP